MQSGVQRREYSQVFAIDCGLLQIALVHLIESINEFASVIRVHDGSLGLVVERYDLIVSYPLRVLIVDVVDDSRSHVVECTECRSHHYTVVDKERQTSVVRIVSQVRVVVRASRDFAKLA